MRRLALLVGLLLAGCDDESLPAKVAGAQLHGIVEAQIACSCQLSNESDPPDTRNLSGYKAQKLVDGACFTTGLLLARGESGAVTCDNGSVSVDDGVITLDDGVAGLFHGEVDVCCTGFNLSAFGVE